MPTDTQDTTAALSQLSTDITDVVKGYAVMEDRADADLRPIVQRLNALHETHAAALLNALETMGGRPEDAGSMMGMVHEAVATARDWFDSLNASALPQIIEGEERLIASYNDALVATPNAHELHDLLADQRAAVQAQIDALKRP
ncbi:hypothetical protein A8B78_11975 [Jannaschia sp. EhC01]|nr:hypothetical protein A8B78_11975 [Jannaschia sp. EhC01]